MIFAQLLRMYLWAQFDHCNTCFSLCSTFAKHHNIRGYTRIFNMSLLSHFVLEKDVVVASLAAIA